MFKKILSIFIASALFLTALTGCSAQQSDGAAQTNELTFCESWDFSGGFYPALTPDYSTNYSAMYYLPNFYETLVKYEDGAIVPGLAESWDVSDDGLIYTFRLKAGVKFSDGTDCDSEAVKQSLEAVPGILGMYNGSYGTVSMLFDTITALDDVTLEVKLVNPYYGALRDFAMYNPLAIASPNGRGADGKPSDATKTATYGTGAYMYSGETDGVTYTFVRNPYYHGKAPALEKFYVKVIPDNDAKQLALRNGEIDLIVGAEKISYDAYTELKDASGFGVAVSEVVSTTRNIGFNVTKAPWNEQSVRLAVSYAIDKQRICDNLFSGLETKADTLFPRSLPYCDVDVETRDYDPVKAIAVLEADGWIDSDGDGIREKNGIKLGGEMIYTTGVALIDDLALTIADDLKKIGMEITVSGMDMMGFYSETMGDFDMELARTYGLMNGDPYVFIHLMNPTMVSDFVASKMLTFVPNAGDVINELLRTADEAKIQTTYDMILREINDNAMMIPVSYTRELAVWNEAKIADYSFGGQLVQVEVSSIKVK